MPTKPVPRSSFAKKPSNPWGELQPCGEGLTVDNFLTTRLSDVTSRARRNITLHYATEAGLSVSEWRILSLVAHARELPFGELVLQSTSDKALVSRTLRALESRGLVEVKPDAGGHRKKLVCAITPSGDALHAQVIPIARQRQAEAICVLSAEERRVLFKALGKLSTYFRDQEEKRPPGRDGLEE
jgi:DNA-binding MarR family transcriptional regulator